jgi:RNA polymerase sigma-70 factor (ECF subfamily)
MGAVAGSSLRPFDVIEWLPLPHDETRVSTSSISPPTSMKAAHGCGASASPTFDEVLACIQDAIYRYALHLTRTRVAADEVYQETVLTAYHEFDRLDGSANHRAWLYGIATNAFLCDRRHRSTEDSLIEESVESDRAATTVQPEAPDLLTEVATFMANLPVRQRLALIQRMYHGLSYTEIAACLQCSEVTARASVRQALRTLRDHFGERL